MKNTTKIFIMSTLCMISCTTISCMEHGEMVPNIACYMSAVSKVDTKSAVKAVVTCNKFCCIGICVLILKPINCTYQCMKHMFTCTCRDQSDQEMV